MSQKICPRCHLPRDSLKYFDPNYCHCSKSRTHGKCPICKKLIYFGDDPTSAMDNPLYCRCKRDLFLKNGLAGRKRFKPLTTDKGKFSLHFCQCYLSYFCNKLMYQRQKQSLRRFYHKTGLDVIYVPKAISFRKLHETNLYEQLHACKIKVRHFRSSDRKIEQTVLNSLNDFSFFYDFNEGFDHIF